MDNVVAVNFDDDSRAYAALTSLKQLDEQGQLKLRGAAVVLRNEDGRIETKEEIGGPDYAGTATGGVVGLIIGVLGGPLGVLIGGYSGILIGSLFDMGEVDDKESA